MDICVRAGVQCYTHIMTGRTHDLFAFTALSCILATQPIPKMSLATGLVALCACFIGGLTPDIDQPTADLWNRLPAGSVIGRIFSPFLGGHRWISHSLIGVGLFAIVSRFLLNLIGHILLVDTHIVWLAFMIGFVSHLVIDMFTKEGIAWLFPIPLHFGIPPIRALRIVSSGMVEKSIIFPGLLFFNVYLYSRYYKEFYALLRSFVL